MIETLKSFNEYFRYVQYAIWIALACALVYFAVNALDLLKNLKITLEPVKEMTPKLKKTMGSVEKIKHSVEYNKPVFAGALVGLGILSTIRSAMKHNKGKNKNIIAAVFDEYAEKDRKKAQKNTVMAAAKQIGPAVNTIKKMIS